MDGWKKANARIRRRCRPGWNWIRCYPFPLDTRPPSGKVFYVEDHRSKSGRCPILSDFSWHVDGGTRAAGQKFFYCLQVKRAYACYRSAIRTWMYVHVRSSARWCARDSSTCLSEETLAVKRQGWRGYVGRPLRICSESRPANVPRPDSDDQANREKSSLQSCCERKRRATVVTDNMQIIGISRRSRPTNFSRRSKLWGNEWTFGLSHECVRSKWFRLKPRRFVVTDDQRTGTAQLLFLCGFAME